MESVLAFLNKSRRFWFVLYQTANLSFISSGNHAVVSLLFPQNLAVAVSRYVFDFPPLK